MRGEHDFFEVLLQLKERVPVVPPCSKPAVSGAKADAEGLRQLRFASRQVQALPRPLRTDYSLLIGQSSFTFFTP